MKREGGIWYVKRNGRWMWCVSLAHAVALVMVFNHA